MVTPLCHDGYHVINICLPGIYIESRSIGSEDTKIAVIEVTCRPQGSSLTMRLKCLADDAAWEHFH